MMGPETGRGAPICDWNKPVMTGQEEAQVAEEQ